MKGLRVTIKKSATGKRDTLRVMSSVGFEIDLVCIADEIILEDLREEPVADKKKGI